MHGVAPSAPTHLSRRASRAPAREVPNTHDTLPAPLDDLVLEVALRAGLSLAEAERGVRGSLDIYGCAQATARAVREFLACCGGR